LCVSSIINSESAPSSWSISFLVSIFVSISIHKHDFLLQTLIMLLLLFYIKDQEIISIIRNWYLLQMSSISFTV
jgi:hypothetical protein